MVPGPDGFKKRFGFFKGSRTLSMKNLIAKMSPMIFLIDLHQLCRIERSSDGVRVCFPKLKFTQQLVANRQRASLGNLEANRFPLPTIIQLGFHRLEHVWYGFLV